MKRITIIVFLIILSLKPLTGQGFEILTDKINKGLNSYFNDKANIKYSIIKFQNNSVLSDIEAQKFYQLLVSKLELNKNSSFIDLVLDFNNKDGVFNLNRMSNLDYSVYINLTNNKNKIGSGIVIYSRDLDKMVFVKYFETHIEKGERDLLKITDYGFKNSGFNKFFELNLDNPLLDIYSIKGFDGITYTLFYYFDKIEIFIPEGNALRKRISQKLHWERPFFPVIKKEGKVFSIIKDKELYFFIGGNFSPYSKVFKYSNDSISETGKLSFTPLSKFTLNNVEYLSGARYATGKNFFLGKIFLMPLKNPEIINDEIFVKKVSDFFSAGFEKNNNNLNTFFLIDKKYFFKRYTQDFTEQIISEIKYGYALGNSGDNYIGISSYLPENDILNISNLIHNPGEKGFAQKIKGRINFISKGIWNERNGLWVLVERNRFDHKSFHLQFWGKNKN